jgi:hypothetical protein
MAFSSEVRAGSHGRKRFKTKLLWAGKEENVMKHTLTLFALSVAHLGPAAFIVENCKVTKSHF